MIVSRRQFLKYCSVAAGALGLTAADLMKLEKSLARSGGLSVLWIAGQACTGCTTSLANSVYYATIQELLLAGPSTPLGTLELKFHETLMAAMSNEATQQANLTRSPFVLAVEGAITPQDGYCQIGSFTGVPTEDMHDVVSYLANHSNCEAILAIGTCASFGGIPAAAGNETGAKGVLGYLGSSVRGKTINIPGCPPNPNWIVGTIAYLLANGLSFPALDALRRPRLYFGERICNNCDRFLPSLAGKFIRRISEIENPYKNNYCLKYFGCKGSRTKSDCSYRKWHSPGYTQRGVNWCVGAGAPCQGCTQNTFPDQMSPFHYMLPLYTPLLIDMGYLNPDWTPWPGITSQPVVEFTARIGDNVMSPTWELGHKYNNGIEQDTKQYVWGNGSDVPFSLIHKASAGTFTLSLSGGPSTTWNSGKPNVGVDHIWLLASSRNAGSFRRCVINNLSLNGSPTNGTLISTNNQMYMHIYNETFHNFTLTGTINFAWSGTFNPNDIRAIFSVELW
ncbi:MAG: hydrogenase small subunit [Nitrospirota bacterium]